MNQIIPPIILILFIAVTINAQSYLKNSSPFLGGMAGVASVNLSSTDGQTPLSFVFGGSIGIPVPFVKNLFLYARHFISRNQTFNHSIILLI